MSMDRSGVVTWTVPSTSSQRSSTARRAPSRSAVRYRAINPLASSRVAASPRRNTTSARPPAGSSTRSEEHTSELQSRLHLVCRLLLEKKKKNKIHNDHNKIHHHLH